MIIDSHAHFGSILDFDLPQTRLIDSMDRNGVDAAVVSNIEGIEYDHCQNPLPGHLLRHQTEINLEALAFSRAYPGRIFPLLWAMPHTGGATTEFKQLLTDHRTEFYGIKIHPFLNQVPFDSPLVEPYIRLAAEYDLPVVTHTAATDESLPERVARMAQKYREVNFLMVHMGLYTNQEESIDLILRYPNIYGDTTWVESGKTMKLINSGGIDKVLFGTDSPLGGLDGYRKMPNKTYLQDWPSVLSSVDYAKLMYVNALRFFRIENH